MLYLLEPAHGIAFTAGLLVLGVWLATYYRTHLAEPDETGEAKANLIVPALNVHAYLLGAVALALPPLCARNGVVRRNRTRRENVSRRGDTAACGVTGQQPIRYRPASRAITINWTSVVPSPISRILLSR